MEAVQWAKGMSECSQTFEYNIFSQYLLNVTEHEKMSTPDSFSSDENSQSSTDISWDKDNFHIPKRFAQLFLAPY